MTHIQPMRPRVGDSQSEQQAARLGAAHAAIRLFKNIEPFVSLENYHKGGT